MIFKVEHEAPNAMGNERGYIVELRGYSQGTQDTQS
jgi:hypothetical protein